MSTWRIPHLSRLHSKLIKMLLLKFYSRVLQECAQFLPKRYRTVVFRLSLDVLNDGVLFPVATGECTIALLPCFKCREDTLFLYPHRRGNFHILDQVSQGHCWVQPREKMDMVLDAVDAIKM